MFIVRFDLRIAPGLAVTHSEQYRHALDMVRWADSRGFAAVALSEHHDTDDGFMHSPLTIAAAMLGATSTISVGVSALLVPLHDPIRLAEEIATIELLTPGRLSVTAGLGYRPSEFEMFAKTLSERRRDFEDAIRLMLDAWSGDDVEYRGSWQEEQHRSSWRSGASSVDDLKASTNYAIVTPQECVELVKRNGSAILHPLAAGIDPRIGWESLELVHNEVMPALGG